MFKYFLFFILLLDNLNAVVIKPLKFIDDSSSQRVVEKLHPKSHINIFLPSIPYSYIAKNTNAGLIRSSDNNKGWVYDLAKTHTRVDDYTYEFELREGLKFQDGTDFDTDSVVENLDYFKKSPILYTNIDNIDFDVIKLDKHRFKILLKQKYEMFFSDLARIYFYSKKYLDTYGFKGAETGSAIQAPGPFGMGPYILAQGFALGEKQTSKLELEANPYYWNADFPKIKRVTVYTQLNTNEAIKMITQEEGKLDIVPIPFNKKIEVLRSKYAKLIISESTNNFIVFFNLINGNKKLRNTELRVALNQAINQENLLNFVYKNEGFFSPFATSVNYKIVKKVLENCEVNDSKFSKDKMIELLSGLQLNVFTQDRFMFLWKGIEYQLREYGVTLNYTITNSEKDIYAQLLTTNKSKNTKEWDLLIWGDDDWYYANPWTVFFIYENDSAWSTIGKDDLMSKYINTFFETKIGTKKYEKIVSKILYRARDKAYTLRVPSPNKVIAVNKEVVFKPYKGAIIPLWNIQITKDHWSIRGEKPYPKDLHAPIKAQRIENENN
ncbi:ABC transporter substrate-binding protein [Sulfurimonas sp.]|uniref:ABC transporter substrate-binding protein n=1 Tax=Sulfurimonas sp. TaxID=2022749 RepID=UPI0025F92C79|nr:ABC transporter substrate-binding protein [Sulfurimonas sp.]